MSKSKMYHALRAGVVISALLASTGLASATAGYFQLGFGPRQNAMGGAGVADSRDAMAMALNPAGIAGMDSELQLGVTLFMPFRGYDAGPGFAASPGVESDSNIFAVPNAAYVHKIDEDSSLGVTLYGNGGMNTNYADTPNAACPPGGSGVFCGGKAGVDLMQAFLSVDYARRFGPLKVGIAPTLVGQRFKADGLGAFGMMGFSSDPTHLTNNGYSYSWGGGLRAGAELSVAENLRLAVSGQTKMWMSKFDKYSGLFSDGGDFDIPAAITAGIAFDATPDLTFTADYQHIFYSGVNAVSNSSLITPGSLGTANGPGFGWHDVDVFKLGAEWRATDIWTLRAGYAYSTNPVKSSDVMFNILAPGVVKHHITAGASVQASEKNSLDFSAMYVPDSSVSGLGMGGQPISIHMHQWQFGAGWTHKF